MKTTPAVMAVDPRFSEHFRNIQQVFLYINDQCNLGCEQCIYKPHVTYSEDREIPEPVVMSLLSEMAGLGAWKLTVLGGEPTLYGRRAGGGKLASVLEYARSTGFTYLRMDTNGHFPPALYDKERLAQLDEVAFSLDGVEQPHQRSAARPRDLQPYH